MEHATVTQDVTHDYYYFNVVVRLGVNGSGAVSFTSDVFLHVWNTQVLEGTYMVWLRDVW